MVENSSESLVELAERVEKAEGADREIDWLVHRERHAKLIDDTTYCYFGPEKDGRWLTYRPTPSATEARQGYQRRPDGMASEQNQQSLTTHAVDFCQSSAPARATDAGPTSSPERRTLNPLFVEWLMGWPIGWTDCGCVEMEFTRWQQDMRGLLSTLCSRTPRQATLL